MAVINVTTIGTILPAELARNLPDDAAQIAHNLLPSTAEFRPLADDVQVATSGVSNPLTLHRLSRKADGSFNDDPATGWIVAAALRQYAKSQINDDTTDRHYYTLADGSAPMRVIDATGVDRRAGVPAPVAKPALTLNVVDEFTTEERTLAVSMAKKSIAEIVRAHATPAWVGAFPPTTDEGYVYMQDTNKTTAPDQPYVARVFRLSSTGGAFTRTITDTYVGAGPSDMGWVFYPSAGAAFAIATADPAWQGGAGTDHVFLYFKALARGFSFDWGDLEDALADIPMPGTTDGTKLLTEDDITGATGIVTRLQSYVDTTDERLRPKYQAVLERSAEMRQLLEEAPPADATDESMATAFVAKRAELEAAVAVLQEHYRWLGPDANIAELLNAVGIYYSEEDIDAQVTPGVVRIVDSRFYIATFVNDWNEESAPSPVSDLVEPDQNDTVGVTVEAAPSGRNIAGWRLYRSNSANQGAAFQLVVDAEAANAVLDDDGNFLYFDIDTLTYTDAKKSSELQEVCPSITWAEPPANLRGLIGLHNGMLGGFFGNTLALCVPFKGFAWPVLDGQLSAEYPIVALGNFGQTVVVKHRGGVDYVSGADPFSMSRQKNVSLQACVSARSVVNVDGGVVFASADGLCLATGAGVRVITARHFTREDWQALDPTSIVGFYAERIYFFTCTGLEDDTCYALHLETGKLGTVDLVGSAFFVDKLTDTLYSVSGTSIKAVFGGTGRRTGEWRSKIAVMASPQNFAWLQVESEFEESITVRWIADGSQRHEVTLTSRAPVRLPAGRYLQHEVEVESEARWNRVTLAGTTAELRAL